MKLVILSAAFVIATTAASFAQGPHLGDANPPGALRQGGVPAGAVMRRDDAMAPPAFRSRNVSGPMEFGNNPTPTRHDPPGTRTQCRGGCD